MSRDAGLAIVIGVIVLAVVVVVGLGAVGMTSTTVQSGPSTVVRTPPEDGSSGVVFDLRERQGQRFLGIRFSADRHYASIALVVPPACIVEDADGKELLRDDGECADLPVRGELTGSGTTQEQGRLAIVNVEISRSCFEAIAVGEQWPTSIEACVI
jgi:hypothetical protein